MFNNFSKIMWKNNVEPSRPQMTISRTRIACCIPTATNTYSNYLLYIAFPIQKWLKEHASMLRYRYSDCLLGSRHVQMKAVRKFFGSNYRKALKSVPPTRCSTTDHQLVGKCEACLDANGVYFKNPMLLFPEYSSNTFYLKKLHMRLAQIKNEF
jgi:hypothetical protein